jgi:hypothetical protein
MLLPAADAQEPPGHPPNSPSQAQTPGPRPPTIITNDNITLPVVTPATRSATSPAPEPAACIQKAAPAPAEDSARKTAEIAALQKQIKDKQKRIELLMHLFVTDERKFVQSPTDTQADPTAQARVHSEQEELRAETAACARLNARLNALTAPGTSPH